MEGTCEYFSMLHEWYESGLTSSDIFNWDNVGTEDTLKLLLNDQSGFSWMGVASLSEETKKNAADPNFELVAMADLTKNAGDIIKTGGVTGGKSDFGGSVSADSENIEYAVKYLNWLWTEEGITASNFGIEDETYHYDDNGDMYWDDVVISNPQGISLKTAQYALCGYVALGYRMNYQVYTMSFSNDAQVEAMDIWTSNRAEDYLYRGSLTSEEEAVYGEHAYELKTYILELSAKYITGSEPLENFWNNVDQMYNMGLQEMTDVKQAAYNRYISGR